MSAARLRRLLTGTYLVLFFGYLFLPLGIMAAATFNSSRFPTVTPWLGFTLGWFQALWEDQRMWAALGTSLMSFCIVAAQLVMVPMAMLVGAKADRWGRKPLLLAAFLVLPLRGVLYTLSDNSAWLVGVQLLDGVGAGLFGALFPLVVADLTEGTGRFNVSQGAIATLQGIGASLSTAAAGQMVVREGYSAAFLMLAGAAGVALLLAALLLPETRGVAPQAADEDGVPPSQAAKAVASEA